MYGFLLSLWYPQILLTFQPYLTLVDFGYPVGILVPKDV